MLTLHTVWWMLSTFALNFAGWSNHFATKNYYGMTAGSAAMLLAARELSGDVISSVVPPLAAASYIGTIMDIQDFRDEVGDRAVGRKTTAVLLGVKKARKVWGVQLLASMLSFGMLVRKRLSLWPDCLVGIGGLALLVSTLRGKSVHDDNKSYKNLILYGFLVYMRSAFWANVTM